MLRVAVSSAVNLPNVETIGKSDPYVLLTFQGSCSVYFINFLVRFWGLCIGRGGACDHAGNIQRLYCNLLFFSLFMLVFLTIFLGVKKKTEVIKDELNPVWNEVKPFGSSLSENISLNFVADGTANLSINSWGFSSRYLS